MPEQSYDEYWSAYLSGHARPVTRLLHYIGLFFGQLLAIALSIFVVWWAFLVLAPVFYMIAFWSHEHVEGNSNEPYASRPLWSAISFFRMLLLDMTGGVGSELARVQRLGVR